MDPPTRSRERAQEDRAPATSGVWQRAAIASGLAILAIGAVATGVHLQDVRHQEALLRGDGTHVLALEREFLAQELRSVRSDLLFLAQQPRLERLLSGDASVRSELEREYLGFARSKPLYDQVRFLDAQGREVIRVHRAGGDVAIVAPSELQSKAARYYFREAIGLGAGDVFVSPLDLNVEHGEIERPPKPVIRLATPVVDDAGAPRGLLVINYTGARLLDELHDRSDMPPGELVLIDRDGQYLRAPDHPNREWGSALGHAVGFSDDHPEAWEQIRDAERAQVKVGDALFTAERVPLDPAPGSSGSAVTIISRIPTSEAIDLRPGARSFALLLGVVGLVVVVALYWARSTVAHRDQEHQITESEARLRLLSSRLLAAQEDERRSLSRVLHDELGQSLTAIALDLKAMRQRRSEAADEPALQRAIEQVDGVLTSVHVLASRVRPSLLDDLGLEDAIESYVSEYEERTGISVDTDLCLPAAGLPDALAENLYRIVQEALSNVSAHAASETARVELVAHDAGIELTVEDAGRGFDAAALKSSSRLGVLGMRERVELLGGRFELETAPLRGTRIHVRLPLSSERHERYEGHDGQVANHAVGTSRSPA